MDRATARDAIGVIATLIGEILEDHAGMALDMGGTSAKLAPAVLELVGEDVAVLARAMAVIERRGANISAAFAEGEDEQSRRKRRRPL